MTITRVGSTSKYANGWEVAFGKVRKSKSSATSPANVKTAGKAAAAGKKAVAKSSELAASKKVATKSAPKKKAGKKSARAKH